jgi:hypothetical protein
MGALHNWNSSKYHINACKTEAQNIICNNNNNYVLYVSKLRGRSFTCILNFVALSYVMLILNSVHDIYIYI